MKVLPETFIWKIKPQDFINRLNWKLEHPFIDCIIHSRSEWGEGGVGEGGGVGVTANQARTVKPAIKNLPFVKLS